MYKAGDRFIIEIEEVFMGKATGYPQYRIKGFDKLIMDDRGLVKLSKFEDKQDAEIKVGDEVKTDSGSKGIVITDTPSALGDISVWLSTCTHVQLYPKDKLTRTGRTFPQIAEVLAEMRGAKNDK